MGSLKSLPKKLQKDVCFAIYALQQGLISLEEINKALVEGVLGGVMETEVVHIQGQPTIIIHVDHFVDFVHVIWLTIGSHTHHLVFAVVHAKTQVSGKRRIQQS